MEGRTQFERRLDAAIEAGRTADAMTPILHIGNKNYSSWSMRPWLALRWAGMSFEERVIPLGGPGYSLTLHNPLVDHGPLQRQKWRHARFAIVVTQRLLEEVKREIGADLPPVFVASMGVDLEAFRRSTPYKPADFNPYHRRRELPVRKVSIDVLKRVFVDRR